MNEFLLWNKIHDRVQISTSQIAICKPILKIATICEVIILETAKFM